VARTPQVAQPVTDRTQAAVVPGANRAGGHANMRAVGDCSPGKATQREISGSHGDEYGDDCLLGCCAVKSGRN
jgi:hypothetical protein